MVVRQATTDGAVGCGGARVQALPLGSAELTWDVFEHDRPEDANELTRLLGRPVLHGHAFVARSADRLVAVDAGMQAGGPFGGLRGSLQRAGLDEHEVGLVLLTHLHPDHAGGLLDGLYPDATVIVPDAEIAFATDPVALRRASAWVQRDYASAPDVLDAIGGRLLPLSLATLPAGWSAVPLPGHSPGHTGYLLSPERPESDAVLFAGDLLHLPELQLHRPHLRVLADFDPERAAHTRASILDAVAANGTVLAGAHLGPHPFIHPIDVR